VRNSADVSSLSASDLSSASARPNAASVERAACAMKKCTAARSSTSFWSDSALAAASSAVLRSASAASPPTPAPWAMPSPCRCASCASSSCVRLANSATCHTAASAMAGSCEARRRSPEAPPSSSRPVMISMAKVSMISVSPSSEAADCTSSMRPRTSFRENSDGGVLAKHVMTLSRNLSDFACGVGNGQGRGGH
jgi:hypothetical protein